MLRVLKSVLLVVIGTIALAVSPSAMADDHHRSKAEGDLESLSARLDWTGAEWALSIHYELEIEDFDLRDTFELVLIPLESGGELVNRSGEVVRMVVPLDVRVSHDDDEAEFEDEVVIRLPAELIGDPFGVRVGAELIWLDTGKLLDDKSTRVKVYRLPLQVVQHVEIREVPVRVIPPPPPPVVVVQPPPPPVVVYRAPPTTVIYRSYSPCYSYWDCGPGYPYRSFYIDIRGWGH